MPKSTNISKEPKVELFCAEMEFVILLKWSGDLGLHLQSAAHVSFKLLGYFLFNEMHLNVNFPSQVFFFEYTGLYRRRFIKEPDVFWMQLLIFCSHGSYWSFIQALEVRQPTVA